MGTSSYIYAIGKRTLTAIVCALTLLGCDSVIYDGEGDCSVNYRVKFRYDMNLKFADAFAREVESVTLYLLDGGGRVVWQRTESGEALGKEGYAMEVDVAPGTIRPAGMVRIERTKVRSGSRNRHPGRS